VRPDHLPQEIRGRLVKVLVQPAGHVNTGAAVIA
jgi:hypothetical protein